MFSAMWRRVGCKSVPTFKMTLPQSSSLGPTEGKGLVVGAVDTVVKCLYREMWKAVEQMRYCQLVKTGQSPYS
jgi:hypothetical protein